MSGGVCSGRARLLRSRWSLPISRANSELLDRAAGKGAYKDAMVKLDSGGVLKDVSPPHI